MPSQPLPDPTPSENGSLLETPPWSNGWLVAAISVSMALHMVILYTPPLAALFSVQALSWREWQIILLLSFPVILLDELLKLISRTLFSEQGAKAGWITALLPRRLRRGHLAPKYTPITSDRGLEMQSKHSDEFGRLRFQTQN